MVQWQAPEEGAGSVTFYACGNGVNLNNMSSGDGAAINSLTLTEGELFSSQKNQFYEPLAVFPNPASEQINLQFPENAQGYHEIQMSDLSGKTVLNQQIDLISTGNTQIHEFDLQQLPTGIYILTVSGETYHAVQRVVVH